MAVKYIFVTGGVVSGLGKGITVASIGRLLKARGLRVTMQKLDPYINIGPGRMSPIQHGEVFITDDGHETDLDIGHYERFADESLTRNSNTSAGRIYWNVISNERKGAYGGGTVQIIPHITDEIKRKIFSAGDESKADVVITEIGGTVGDIESMPFLEAIRQVASDVGRENCVFVQVALIPYLNASGELKTKPVQHSVKELLNVGIQPDVIVCRTEMPINDEIKRKIGLFCNVSSDAVIQNITAPTIYEIPLIFEQEGLSKVICDKLSLDCGEPDLAEWRELVNTFKYPEKETTVAIVGKDAELHDSYLSVYESLLHAGIANKCRVNLRWIDAHDINESNAKELLDGVDGILSPGGYGADGAHGQVVASEYARTHNIAFLGIGLGMELAVLGFARNACGLSEAQSKEFNVDASCDVIYAPEKGTTSAEEDGVKRGARETVVSKGTKLYDIYKEEKISERHWNTYEVNPKYYDVLEKNGLVISGKSTDCGFADAIELADHRFFVGVIFHPQFKSRPNRPHKLIKEFVGACLK
ncbi:MAG: CTP synthase [Ruminococcaceae bacterium]|nr:CTP synthase [Oscillospiraceae bacterium]